MFICVFKFVCAYMWEPGLVSNVFLRLSPPISFEAVSLTETGTHCFSSPGRPDALGLLLGPLR